MLKVGLHKSSFCIMLLSLSGEDPPEKAMAAHSSICAWRIPWTGEPIMFMGLQSQTQLSD